MTEKLFKEPSEKPKLLDDSEIIVQCPSCNKIQPYIWGMLVYVCTCSPNRMFILEK